MTISYLYWKTGQGVNFGSCEDGYAGLIPIPSKHLFQMAKRRLEKQGFTVELEEETPELRAEQLQRIRSTPPTQGNKQ